MANFNKAKKYHFIYKTTCLLNDKYYVGMHSTNNLDDGYLGSGTRLRHSIRKYGEENFKLEILEFLPNRESLVEREKELINEHLLTDDNCLNLMKGGLGGFISEEVQKKRSVAANKALQKKMNNDPEFRKIMGEKISKGIKKAYKEGKITAKYFYSWEGKKRTEETKRKIGESNKGRGVGEENSQYGTCWITNGSENKKIKNSEPIPDGWDLGRSFENYLSVSTLEELKDKYINHGYTYRKLAEEYEYCRSTIYKYLSEYLKNSN